MPGSLDEIFIKHFGFGAGKSSQIRGKNTPGKPPNLIIADDPFDTKQYEELKRKVLNDLQQAHYQAALRAGLFGTGTRQEKKQENKEEKSVAIKNTHYDTLSIKQNASDADIKKAYRAAARTHHPDKGGDPDEFMRVKEAYEILSDRKRRKRYNAALLLVKNDPLSDLPPPPSGLKVGDIVYIIDQNSVYYRRTAVVKSTNSFGYATVQITPGGEQRVSIDKNHLKKIGISNVNPTIHHQYIPKYQLNQVVAIKNDPYGALLYRVMGQPKIGSREYKLYHSAIGNRYAVERDIVPAPTVRTGVHGFRSAKVGLILLGDLVWAPSLQQNGRVHSFKQSSSLTISLTLRDGKAEVLADEVEQQRLYSSISGCKIGDMVSVAEEYYTTYPPGFNLYEGKLKQIGFDHIVIEDITGDEVLIRDLVKLTIEPLNPFS